MFPSLRFLSARVPASGYLWDGAEERGEEALFHPPHPTLFPGGAAGLVCDLASHMIETRLILLGINILQWTRGDSRRENRGEDERRDV